MKKENTKCRYNGLQPTDGSVAFAVAIIFSLILSMAVAFITDPNTQNIVYSIVLQIAFMSFTFFFAYRACKRDCPHLVKRVPDTLYSLGFNKRVKGSLIGISVVLPIFCILAFLPVSILVEKLFGLLGFHAQPSYADFTKSAELLIASIFAICILPAFGEEMLLRGAVARSLRVKGTIFAITFSALLFALMHGSPVQFIHQFLIGLIMAYIVILTDCLWYSVIFHFVNNFSVILYEFIYVQAGATYVIPKWAYAVMFVVGIIGVGLLLVLFTKCHIKNTEFVREQKRLVEQKGKVKGTLEALFNTSEYKYKAYDKTPYVAFYTALAIVVIIWIMNTVVGWIG